MLATLKRLGRRVQAVYSTAQTASPPLEAHRMAQATRAARPGRSAAALLVLMIGFTLDDLAVLRVPGYLAGAVVAFLILLFGPTWKARQWIRRRVRDQHRRDLGHQVVAFEVAMENRHRRGLLKLVGAGAIVAGWLMVFSAGVPFWVT